MPAAQLATSQTPIHGAAVPSSVRHNETAKLPAAPAMLPAGGSSCAAVCAELDKRAASAPHGAAPTAVVRPPLARLLSEHAPVLADWSVEPSAVHSFVCFSGLRSFCQFRWGFSPVRSLASQTDKIIQKMMMSERRTHTHTYTHHISSSYYSFGRPPPVYSFCY